MSKKNFIIVFLLSLLSCGQKTESLNDNSDMIFVLDSVEIPISPDEYFASIQNHIVLEGQKPYLLRESRMKNSIEIYDWEDKKKHSRITFKTEGPNSLRSFGSSALYPFRLDSILVANLVGDIYYTKADSVLHTQSNYNGYRFFGESSYKPTRIGDKIFLHKASNFRQTNPSFYRDFAIVSYDVTDGRIESIPVEFPERFKNNCWSEHHWYVPFTSNNQGHLVLSFSTEPGILLYDPEKQMVVASHEVESSLAGAVDPLPNCDTNDLEKYYRYLQSNPRYLSLTFDPYQNVYYRIIALPIPGVPEGQRDFLNALPFSLMVLDESFNVIAEKKFPGRKYDMLDFFVTEEGLWLSRNNEDADDFDENRIFYDLIGFTTMSNG